MTNFVFQIMKLIKHRFQDTLEGLSQSRVAGPLHMNPVVQGLVGKQT